MSTPSFNFILTGEDRQGSEVTRSFSLTLDKDHITHFGKFLSDLISKKIRIDHEALAEVSQQYCLELANMACADSCAL